MNWIEIIGLIFIPVMMGLAHFIHKVISEKIQVNTNLINTVKSQSEKAINDMQQEVKATIKKDDTLREINRIDRDIDNLRISTARDNQALREDMKIGFDRLYETLKDNKTELLQAIENLGKRRD